MGVQVSFSIWHSDIGLARPCPPGTPEAHIYPPAFSWDILSLEYPSPSSCAILDPWRQREELTVSFSPSGLCDQDHFHPHSKCSHSSLSCRFEVTQSPQQPAQGKVDTILHTFLGVRAKEAVHRPLGPPHAGGGKLPSPDVSSVLCPSPHAEVLLVTSETRVKEKKSS